MLESIATERVADKPLEIAVTVHDRQVVLHLSEPREYVALEDTTGALPLMLGQRLILAGVEARKEVGQAAIMAALSVVDGIYELRGDLKPAGGAAKHELIERHRHVLTQRISIMLNSTREKKKINNATLAKMVTEAMLKEVFS